MKNIISAEDYRGTSIESALKIDKKPSLTIGELKKGLNDNLSKGLIDPELYGKAISQLDSIIEKASKGEGSKGGHIIGHTKSGKPVYGIIPNGDHKQYKDFTSQDHKDAANLHQNQYDEHSQRAHSASDDVVKKNNYAISDHHRSAEQSHIAIGGEKGKVEAHAGLADHEKKIISDQKKKEIQHHQDKHEFHSNMVKHVEKFPYKGSPESTKHMIDEHTQLANHHKSEKERLEKE